MATDEIWYAACEPYGPFSDNWTWFLESSRLHHVTEIASLDGILNAPCLTPNFDRSDVWENVVTDESMILDFFKSLDFVVEKTKNIAHFNLYAVIREPSKEKPKQSELDQNFTFLGYDLVETGGTISALTNCGGFDETFLPQDLNQYGLIQKYNDAKEIVENLFVNNPDEHHAACYFFEVWRHKIIGRQEA